MITDNHLPIRMPVRPLDPTDLCPGLNQKLKSVSVDAPGMELDMLLLGNQTVPSSETINGYLTHWVIPEGFKHLPYDGIAFGDAEAIKPPLPFKASLCWDLDLTNELNHNRCSNALLFWGPHGCIPILRSKNDLLFFEADEAFPVLSFKQDAEDSYTVEPIRCKVFMLAILPNFSNMYLGFESREAAHRFIEEVYSRAEPGCWIEVGAPIWMEGKGSFVAAYVRREGERPGLGGEMWNRR